LALKLMDFEVSPHKKVPALIWFGEYKKALDLACSSYDTNLISLLILKILKQSTLDEQHVSLLLDVPVSKKLLFKLVEEYSNDNHYAPMALEADPVKKEKVFQPVKASEFNAKYGTNEKKILYGIWRCNFEQKFHLEIDKGEMHKKFTNEEKRELVKGLLSEFKFKDEIKSYENFLTLYANYLESLPPGDVEETPVLTTFMSEFSKNESAGAAYQKKHQISDRFAFVAKLRTYCDKPSRDSLEKLDKLICDYNKNGKLMPFFDLTEFLLERGLIGKAEKYAMKIDDVEDKIFWLKHIQTSTSMKAALELALQSKDLDLIFSIQSIISQMGNAGRMIMDQDLLHKINYVK